MKWKEDDIPLKKKYLLKEYSYYNEECVCKNCQHKTSGKCPYGYECILYDNVCESAGMYANCRGCESYKK